MPTSYPIEPQKLLDAADTLAPRAAGPGRPPYTAHRRAVSTAYYAVFHAMSERVAAVVFPNADQLFRQRIRRWIGHGDVCKVAEWVSHLHFDGGAPRHIHDLLTPTGSSSHIDAVTVAIADGFLELNEKREQADYDHEAVFGRADTRGHIALAREVVRQLVPPHSDSLQRFLGLIALQAQIRKR